MSEQAMMVLGLKDAARRLGVSRAWLRREALAGRVPALRAGATFLFSAAALESAIARRASQCGGVSS